MTCLVSDCGLDGKKWKWPTSMSYSPPGVILAGSPLSAGAEDTIMYACVTAWWWFVTQQVAKCGRTFKRGRSHFAHKENGSTPIANFLSICTTTV